MVDFYNKLKLLRESRHLTQAQLGQRLGLSDSVISAYESGSKNPNFDNFVRIAAIFGVTTDYLLGIKDDCTVNLSGLTTDQSNAVLNLVSVMKESNKSQEK